MRAMVDRYKVNARIILLSTIKAVAITIEILSYFYFSFYQCKFFFFLKKKINVHTLSLNSTIRSCVKISVIPILPLQCFLKKKNPNSYYGN